jgi:hypothetical protein
MSRPTPGKPPAQPKRQTPAPVNPRSVEVPLELVVACGADGIVIHPGGYRLSLTSLKRDRGLRRDLVTIVRNYAMIDPLVRPRPRLKFLVEPGGGESYAEARRQTVLTNLDWPVQLQVAGGPAPWGIGKERF